MEQFVKSMCSAATGSGSIPKQIDFDLVAEGEHANSVEEFLSPWPRGSGEIGSDERDSGDTLIQ